MDIREFKILRLRTAATDKHATTHDQNHVTVHFSRVVLRLHILGDPGADSGGEGKSKRAGKYGTKKSQEQREEPLGTMSYQTSSKWSPLF